MPPSGRARGAAKGRAASTATRGAQSAGGDLAPPQQQALDPGVQPGPGGVQTNNLRAYGGDHPLWADAHFAQASLPYPQLQLPVSQAPQVALSHLLQHWLTAHLPPGGPPPHYQQPQPAGLGALGMTMPSMFPGPLGGDGAGGPSFAQLFGSAMQAAVATAAQGGMRPGQHRPQSPPKEAKAWTKPEDKLIIDMMRAKFEKRTPDHTYSTIGRLTGRSANAVKCRWQNKLKYEVDFKLQTNKSTTWTPQQPQQAYPGGPTPPPGGGGGAGGAAPTGPGFPYGMPPQD